MNKIPLIIYDDSHKSSSLKTSKRKQNLLLKGMTMHPDNFKAAAKVAGIRTMAEAYRTLDLLALRKDYHRALFEENVDMAYIVKSVKTLADTADLDSVKLAALRILMKSLGLESYKIDDSSARTWEDILMESVEDDIKPVEKYEVSVPQIPESAKKRKEESKEAEIGKELYEQDEQG